MNKSVILLISLVLTISACSSTQNTGQSGSEPIGNEVSLKKKFLAANKARLLDKHEDAETLFLECLKIDGKHHASLYELARLQLKKKDLPAAKHYAIQAADLDPSNQWYQNLLYRIYKDLEDFESSIDVLKRMQKNEPNLPEHYYNLLKSYDQLKRFEDSRRVFSDLEKRFGKQEEILKRKYRWAKKQQDLSWQEESLKDLIEINSAESSNYLKLFQLYENQGREKEAQSIMEKLSEQENPSERLWLIQAQSQRRNNKSKGFFETCKKAFANPELSLAEKLNLQVTLRDSLIGPSKHRPEVLQLAETIAETHPQNAKAQTLLADQLSDLKRFKEAEKNYERALTLEKSDFGIWQGLLYNYNRQRNYKALLSSSKEALGYFPNQAELYMLKGLAEHRLGENAIAVKTLKQGSLVGSGASQKLQADIFSLLGDAYSALGDDAQSETAYEKGLAADPNNAFILNNYAYLLAQLDVKLDKAFSMAEKAIEKQPSNASFLDTYGWVLFRKGQYPEAKKVLLKANELSNSKDAEVLEHLGDVLFHSGEKNQAMNYWQKAKERGGKGEFLETKINSKQYVD